MSKWVNDSHLFCQICKKTALLEKIKAPPAKSYKSEYKWYISKYLFIYFIIDPNIVWAWIMSNVHCFSQEWLEIV